MKDTFLITGSSLCFCNCTTLYPCPVMVLNINHINELELLAIYYGLLSFLHAGNKATNHIRVMSDNVTAISYINKKGGSKSLMCNKISSDIWKLCIKYKTHFVSSTYTGQSQYCG